jgi:hypothetical protein
MAYFKDASASLILPPAQEDEVIRLIEAAGLDATEFIWAVRPSRYRPIGLLVSALTHTPTGASFRFEFLESSLGMNRVSVVALHQSGSDATSAAASWEDQRRHVQEWLTRLADATG